MASFSTKAPGCMSHLLEFRTPSLFSILILLSWLSQGNHAFKGVGCLSFNGKHLSTLLFSSCSNQAYLTFLSILF